MAELVATVWVKDKDNHDVSYGPDDDVSAIPADQLAQMGDHCFVDGKRPAAKAPAGKATAGKATEK